MEKILFFKKGSMTTFWSKEDEKALAEAFNYRFSKYLKEELFFIESALCQENLQVRVTLKSKENDKSRKKKKITLTPFIETVLIKLCM